MSKYPIAVPRSRGISEPDKFDINIARGFVSGLSDVSDLSDGDSKICDLIIHAAICRIAYTDNSTEEFYTKYDRLSQIVDIDIPDKLLDYLMRVEVGPKLERYFSWLTNGVKNLRRDMMQFTIAADPTINSGLKGIGLQVGYSATIERVDVLANAPGIVEIDIWKVPAESWPGDSNYSMIGSQPISILSGNKNIDAPINTWDNELVYGDILVYNVSNAVGVSLVTTTLYVCRHSIFELD